uniref:Uncharacterized protein n=1 Tax=Panagrolaimus sp. ES5 TaxID=591445 RepID=A0AC34G2Y5_9BILA
MNVNRKLKDTEIEDEWVPFVQNPTDFVDLNKPSDNVDEVIIVSDNDSEVEIIEPKDIKKNDATTVTQKINDDKKITVTNKDDNIFDISFSCLNDPIKNMGINDSIEFANDIPMKIEKADSVLSIEDRKDLSENTQQKMEVDVIEKIEQKDSSNLMTNEEEVKVKKDATETFAEFCKRKKIKKDAKAKTKYNLAIKTAEQKIKENERLKECMKKKRSMESSQERHERLQKKAESMQKHRENESKEEKEERLQKDAVSKQVKHENENEKEKQESCCQQGKVKMETGVEEYPELLKNLMTKTHPNN